MQAALVGSADQTNELSADSDQATGLAGQNATLTTIAVSDKLQIITTANAAASEQSVADFALAMGLDPNQVKTLFGESAANAAAAKLAGSNPSTQQILGINSSPGLGLTADAASAVDSGKSMAFSAQALAGSGLAVAMDGPVSTADFQTLQAQAPAITADAQDMLGKMENLQIQLGSAQAQLTAGNSSPASTLAVLSMMDTQLRAEDIEALKNEFDALSTFDSLPAVGKDVNATPLSPLTNRPAALAQAPTAPAFANNPDMAQTFDKLSQKLTTELAARMHEKLNAGEWKMKFALKPASLGLVDVQLEMRDGKLSAHFQSDTNLTKDLLQNGSQRLKDALADLGMNNASVFVAQGQAQGQGAQGQSARSGKFTQGNDNREKLSEESGLKIAGDRTSRRDERSQFDSYA
jgi:flagellar hook-length control protein FliK